MKQLLPLIAVGLLSLLSPVSKEREVQQAWIPQAIMLGSSLLGGLFGNRAQKQTQFQRSNSQNNSSFDNYNSGWNYGENRTNYDPALMGLRNKIIDTGMGLVGSQGNYGDPTQLAQSIVQGNIWGANKQAGLQQRLMAQGLRSRGLSGSTAGAYAATRGDADRVSAITQSMNQMPQLQRQFSIENENLNNARTQLGAQLFGMIPKDTVQESGYGGRQSGMSENKGTQESYGESTTPSNMMGGGLNSLSSMLAYLMGNGMMGGGASTPSSFIAGPMNPMPTWSPQISNVASRNWTPIFNNDTWGRIVGGY